MMNLKIEDTRYVQYLASVAAALVSVSIGMMGAWSSPTLKHLQSEDSPIGVSISDEEGSWVVASMILGSLPATFIAQWALDHFGRKKTLLLSGVISFAHWLMLIFSNSLATVIIARVIGGIAMGISIPCIVLYTAEIPEEDIRGRMGTLLILLKTFGTVIVLVIGPYVSYTVLAIICSCSPIIFFCCFFFMPESPFYYVKVGDNEEAMKSLTMLSKKNASDKFLKDRLGLIQRTIEEDMKNKGSYLELLTKRVYRFTLFLVVGIKSMQQFNGNAALEAYLQPIFESSNSGIDPEIASIIVGAIQLPAVYLSGHLVDKLGRKPLLFISTIGCCIALVGEGTYFLIKDYFEKDTSPIGWLPTVGLGLFWICNPIGMMTLPYVLLGELFPTNIKGPAVSLATLYGGLTSFLVSKFFKPLSNAIGIYSVFYIFAGICFAGIWFVFFFLPETKGKNLQEIQDMIHNKRRKRSAEDANLS